jgi:hypothetical protein
MKILDSRVWFRIKCDCGNELILSDFGGDSHCEDCERIYSYEVKQREGADERK